MTKAKKPNEIREEVRKQTAAKYKEEIERLKKLASDRWDNYMDAIKRLVDLHDENEQLKEKLTDAFIDKACKYFRTKKKCVFACIGEDVYHSLLNEEEIEDFKKAMKGK